MPGGGKPFDETSLQLVASMIGSEVYAHAVQSGSSRREPQARAGTLPGRLVTSRPGIPVTSRPGIPLELQGLDLQVFLEPVRAEFAAVPRLAEPAEGRGHVPRPAIHLDLPGSQPPGDGHRMILVG